jgi:hypothetical protein
MAIDLSGQYDVTQVQKSVFNETANANRVVSVNAAGTVTPGATEATQLQVLQAVQDLEPNASLSAVGTPVRLDYSGTNVTSSAYVTLQADTGSTAIRQVNIFDSSGYTIYLAFGAAASEVNKIMICPGGPGQIPLSIPANTRLSLKAVSTSATAGEIVVSFFG